MVAEVWHLRASFIHRFDQRLACAATFMVDTVDGDGDAIIAISQLFLHAAVLCN